MVKKGDKGGEKKSSLLLETWGWFYENTKSKQNEQETREQAAEEGPGFGLTAQESRLGSWAEWAGHPRYKSAGPCPLHRGTSLAPQPCEPHPEGAEAPSPRTSLGSPDLGKTRQGPRAQSPRAPLPAARWERDSSWDLPAGRLLSLLFRRTSASWRWLGPAG